MTCTADTGECIIVEMQNRWQEHFKDRALFYSARSIVQQGLPGSKWDFKLTPVYGVFFTNFLLDKDDTNYFCKDVALIEKQTGKVFSNKLRQIFIEIPRFRKEKADCENFFECWIYNLVNMKNLKEISFKDKNEIFNRLERVASQANLSKEERAQYEYEWKIYNDYFNTIESAEKKAAAEASEKAMKEGLAKGLAEGMAKGLAEGVAKGRAEALLDVARGLLAKGLSADVVSDVTGIPLKEIETI